MNRVERAEENSCSDDCSSQSVTSTTSSQTEDLEWDNYSPPLCSCTDECSCTTTTTTTTTSASQCILCGGHSRTPDGPCPSLNGRPHSRAVACSRETSSRPPLSCARPLHVVCRDETDDSETLRSIDTTSCSMASRLVSSTQDDVLEASIVLSGKPSSASIDFRRKCTAYWDGVQSLQSISTSTERLTEAASNAEDTCFISAYSLLSLTDSDQSSLCVSQSFSADDRERGDRIAVTRTTRSHSADDIFRFRISCSDRYLDDEAKGGSSSAVQFSQTVTTHCYDGDYSFHSALPVQECDTVFHCANEDQDRWRNQSSDLEAGDSDSCNHVHRSKRCKDRRRKHSKVHQREHTGHCRRQCGKDRIEDEPNDPDHIDSCRSYRDPSDQFKDHENTRKHPWRIGHRCRDAKLPDHCSDSKDRNGHSREYEGNRHNSRDDVEPLNCNTDHPKDHHSHKQHIRLRSARKRSQGNRNPGRNTIDGRRDSCCADRCCCSECAGHRTSSGYKKQHFKNAKNGEDTCKHPTNDSVLKRHRYHKHNRFCSTRFQDKQDQHRSEGNQKCPKVNSTEEVHSDASCATYKVVVDSCSRSFSSDTDSDHDDYGGNLRRRQSSRLRGNVFDLLGFTNRKRAQETKDEKKEYKTENGECEDRTERLETKCTIDNACNIRNILSSGKSRTCERTRPENQVEERQMDVDIQCCDYPQPIPPLEYFLVRARVGIEGDLDERPQNASPLFYEPKPAPLRSCTPEQANEISSVEPIHEVQSNECFEPPLALPPLSRRTLSRAIAQGIQSIFAGPPSVYMPDKLYKTPVLAFKSKVDGDRRPTSIRGKAENMPIVRRFIPTQMGDITDVHEIEALSSRQSWGLKPELVGYELVTAASITKRSFAESERRRIRSKSVGWAGQAAEPAPAIQSAPCSAENESFFSMASCATLDSAATPCPAQDSDPKSLRYQPISSSTEIRISSQSPGCTSGPTSSLLRSILVSSRVSDDSGSSSTLGGNRMSSFPEDRRLYSMSGGRLLPSLSPGEGRLSEVPYDRLGYPDNATTSSIIDPDDVRYTTNVPDSDSKRQSAFGFSDRRVTIRLSRHSNINPYGLTIAYFASVPEVLPVERRLAEADVRYMEPSFNIVEPIPAIQDLVVQIPSQTEPLQATRSLPYDDSDVTCLRELLAVPLSGQDDSDSDGQQCMTSCRSSDPCLVSSSSPTDAVPLRGQPKCPSSPSSSSRPLINIYPSDNNYLCTSVTQIVSRSMKHDRDSDGAAMRDKCSLSDRSKWYRSLSSKNIHDVGCEGSFPDGNMSSSSSETTSEACPPLNRTSTWVDSYTLPSAERRRPSQKPCAGHLFSADEFGEELPEVVGSSCTDSVTTVYTRLPTSPGDRQRTKTINCCALAKESCDKSCFSRPKRCCREFERRLVNRKCRHSSPETALSCGHRCRPPAVDKIVSSTVVVSPGRHRCKTGDWTDDGERSREQTYERKYRALKQFCIEALGCVPPPPTPLYFE